MDKYFYFSAFIVLVVQIVFGIMALSGVTWAVTASIICLLVDSVALLGLVICLFAADLYLFYEMTVNANKREMELYS